MVNVIFGRENVNRKYILDTRVYFRQNKKESWFQDEFVQGFLLGVDGTKVVQGEVMIDRFGKPIIADMISTGCKTLCDIYFDTNNTIFYGSAMGDNCIPYYVEIARHKDITLFYEHYPYIDNKYFNEGIFVMNGKVLGEYDFDDGYSAWCASTRLMED